MNPNDKVSAGHTAGPWWAHKNPHLKGPFSYFITDDPAYDETAEFAEIAAVNFSNEDESNAHLLASAPDLLAIVQDYLNGVENGQSPDGWLALSKRARSAIARARGGAS